MYGRTGLDRFKKAQTVEPFSVSIKSDSKNGTQSTATTGNRSPSLPQAPYSSTQFQQNHVDQKSLGPEAAPLLGQTHQGTHIGGGQSTWQPPDWGIEPRPGVYYLEVMKDGQVVDRINLDKRRNLFGRQAPACDFVLDHQSVSRQHAAVVPHKNGSVYVIDLGSVHGTFVANERLTKDSPVELEVGQSLRFAASTRTYILRKNEAALFYRPQRTEIDLPPPPDPSDEDAVVVYNTLLNRYGITRSDLSKTNYYNASGKDENNGLEKERATKRMRKARVSFRDQVGGQLVEVVGVSDGVDVETEPGPLGVKEGSLVGKYESLVQITVIPKGKGQSSAKDGNISQKGVTDKLQEVLNKVKSTPKGGMYDDLYGDSLSDKVGSSWAYSSVAAGDPALAKDGQVNVTGQSNDKPVHNDGEVDDDLFGD